MQIEGDGKNYIDLNNSKFELKVNLTTIIGGDIGTGTKVEIVILPLRSLFQSVTMTFAHKMVNESNNF